MSKKQNESRLKKAIMSDIAFDEYLIEEIRRIMAKDPQDDKLQARCSKMIEERQKHIESLSK